MLITLKIAFGEQGMLRMLNSLRDENVREMRYARKAGRPLPLLYRSGVVYERESRETWSDVICTLAQGKEDCDALAALRAAEIVVWGAAALTPGDGGYRQARRQRLRSIPAEVYMTTRVRKGQSGLYHCVVRYRIDGVIYRDDPSARLGMRGPIRRDQHGVPQ